MPNTIDLPHAIIRLVLGDESVAHTLPYRASHVSPGQFLPSESSLPTESSVLWLLSDVVERGLDSQKSTLFVIDGGKALRQSIRRVFGKRGIVQRCQLHKTHNVIGHLPKALQASVRQALRAAYAGKNDKTAVRRLKQLASSLSEVHPRAAASLKEGLERSKWPRRTNRAATES